MQIMDTVLVARSASTAMATTHSCLVSFPFPHKFQGICLCPCFLRHCHSAWLLLRRMIRMKHVSTCGPDRLQAQWDVPSARSHPEQMVTASHYIFRLLESYQSSKI